MLVNVHREIALLVGKSHAIVFQAPAARTRRDLYRSIGVVDCRAGRDYQLNNTHH
jgi:hypothetical protein